MRGLGKILGTRRQEVIFYSDFNDIARFEQHLDLPIDNKDMGFWEIDQIIQAPVPLAQVPPDEGLPGGVEGGESVPPDPRRSMPTTITIKVGLPFIGKMKPAKKFN